MDSKTDPVIIDLLKWLKDNLPPETDEEAIFKKVRRVQKIFDTLIGLSFEEFYNYAITCAQQEPKDDCLVTAKPLEESVNAKLENMKEYLNLNEEKIMKTKKLNGSRARLDLKKEQYKLISSIQLEGCMDLIRRYNNLMSKK